MKISDTTTPAVTIVLEGTEIDDIQTICGGYLAAYRNSDGPDIGLAENILYHRYTTAQFALKELEGP
jgi:hypothetical protein